MAFKVIYLTGAPAAGKSTVCRKLLSMRKDLRIFEYGKENEYPSKGKQRSG